MLLILIWSIEKKDPKMISYHEKITIKDSKTHKNDPCLKLLKYRATLIIQINDLMFKTKRLNFRKINYLSIVHRKIFKIKTFRISK
jgi:hypothetical protein